MGSSPAFTDGAGCWLETCQVIALLVCGSVRHELGLVSFTLLLSHVIQTDMFRVVLAWQGAQNALPAKCKPMPLA